MCVYVCVCARERACREYMYAFIINLHVYIRTDVCMLTRLYTHTHTHTHTHSPVDAFLYWCSVRYCFIPLRNACHKGGKVMSL